MRITVLAFTLILTGCYDVVDVPGDAGPDVEAPRNDLNTPGGLCCQITNNFHDEPFWNNGFYRCVHPGDKADPFNPPYICNVTFDGECDVDGGPACLTCFDPDCVVGMRCRDVNGTGTVIPCR